MAFGKKVTISDMQKGGGGGGGDGMITYIPKEGSLTVRFVGEPEDESAWIKYREVYDRNIGEKGGSYPLPEEGMPGYTDRRDEDVRVSTKYLAVAIDTENDRVIIVQIPVSLSNQLAAYYKKKGSLTDRDFELFKDGTGKDDTVYGYSPESPIRRQLKKFQKEIDKIDLEAVLEGKYNAVFSVTEAEAEEDEDDEDFTPARRGSVKRPNAPAAKAARRKKASGGATPPIKKAKKPSPAKSVAAKKTSASRKVAPRRLKR